MKLIDSTKEFSKEINYIKNNCSYVTIDTEFVREKTYYSTLGLVQIGYEGDGNEFAVDPLSVDFTEFDEQILQDEKIVKVFHAATADLEILYNMFAHLPVNLFDTQIGARFLGHGESISYSNLVQHYEGITLDKTQRYTDWMQRPLEEDQIRYALSDVDYLKNIYLKMLKELKELGRDEWAIEECQKLLTPDLYDNDPDFAYEKIKIKSHTKPYIKAVKALCRWREVTAQNLNKPRGRILRDDAIQELASVKPKTVQELRKLRFYYYDAKFAPEILGVIDHSENEEVELEKDKKRERKPSQTIVNMLKLLLLNQSEKHDLASSTIASSDDVKYIALGEYEKSSAMQGWRYEVFGKYADKLLKSEIAITIHNGEVIFIEPEYDN